MAIEGWTRGIPAYDAEAHASCAGQIGWNAEQRFESRDYVGQAAQALRNVVAVVEAAGGKAADIVRLSWYVTDRREYLSKQREVGEAYRAVMGRHFPAMTLLVVSGLAEDEALVSQRRRCWLSPGVDRRPMSGRIGGPSGGSFPLGASRAQLDPAA